MSESERQLLIGAHRGDEDAARALWEHHGPRLVLYAGTILRNAADAEDAVQQALCRVLALPSRRVREVREVAAFLASVVRGTALNMLRTAHRERRRVRASGLGNQAEHVGVLAQLDSELAVAIAGLPRRLAEVVVLKHVAGLTFDQVALALGQNRNTVAARHRSATDRLRAMLGAAEGRSAAGPLHPPGAYASATATVSGVRKDGDERWGDA